MSDIQIILNDFAQTVGAQIKVISDRVDIEMAAMRDSIGAMVETMKTLEERDPSEAIEQIVSRRMEELSTKAAEQAAETRQSIENMASKLSADVDKGLAQLAAIEPPPTADEVSAMVLESVETVGAALYEKVDKHLASIEIPQPEEPIHGVDGKDATQIEVLPCIDPEKSYPRGTHALHNGGTWRAYQKTVGMTGWECVMNGVASVDVTVEGKTLRIVSTLSDGTKSEATKTIPFPEYKGVYVADASYEKGDSATHDGAVWIALEDAPKDAPGSGKGWQLAVKRGRDGRGLYAIARAAGFTGTEKELLPFILKGEAPNNVVRLKDGLS